MSQENVEIVRRWIGDYNRRHTEGLIGLTTRSSCSGRTSSPSNPSFRGYEGLRTYFTELDDVYERFEVVPSDMIDAGSAVLMVAHARWRGKARARKEKRRFTPRSGLRPARSFEWRRTRIEPRPSKPWGCRSKTLTPTPEPAGYGFGYRAFACCLPAVRILVLSAGPRRSTALSIPLLVQEVICRGCCIENGSVARSKEG